MRIVSTKIIKTTLLACLPCLLINFSSCSFFNDYSTGSVSLNVNSVRSALSKIDEAFIDIELNGDYEDKQTISITSESPVSVTFSKVPIGANVFVSAKAYSLYKDDKVIIYSGTSERKTIEDGDNTFAVKMQTVYDSLAQGPYSCLISKPLFYTTDDVKLKTNRLEFNNTNSSFYWKYDKLNNYQKLNIIYRKAFDTDFESQIKFIMMNTETTLTCELESKPVPTDTVSYEFMIPDDAEYNALCITNSVAAAAEDFTCIIESIELQTVGAFNAGEHINMPGDEDIEVEILVNGEAQTSVDLTQVFSLRSDKTLKLIAEEGFTSYSWKFNGEVKSSTREFSLGAGDSNSVNITTLNYSANPNAIYEITLLADSASEHKSWTLQLKFVVY